MPPSNSPGIELAKAPLSILGRSVPRRGVITAGVMVGMFLAGIEATVVGTALPTIAEQLEGLTLYGIAMSSYLIAGACFMPVWGRLSDLYGRRPAYLAALGLFLAGSALAGAAGSMLAFIAGRAVQGVGSAGIMAIGVTMLGDIFTLKERARVQGYLASVWALSSVIGPVVGGLLTQSLSWRYAFLLNIPPGIVTGALIGLSWRAPANAKAGRVGVGGMVLLVLSLGQLFAALSVAELGPTLRAACAAGGLVSCIALAQHCRRSATPVIDVTLLSSRAFRTVFAMGVLLGNAIFCSLAFAPLFAQGVLETSPMKAGAALVPAFLVWSAGSAVAGRLALHVGFRALAVGGAALTCVAYLLLSLLHEGSSYAHLLVAQALLGAGLGGTVVPQLILVQASVRTAQRGSATALIQFSRQLGGALGVATLGVALTATLVSEVERTGPTLGVSVQRARQLAESIDTVTAAPEELTQEERRVVRSALCTAIHRVFQLGLCISLLMLPFAALIPREPSSPDDGDAPPPPIAPPDPAPPGRELIESA